MEADVALKRLYGGFHVFPAAVFMLQGSLENKNTSHHTEISAWETQGSNRI